MEKLGLKDFTSSLRFVRENPFGVFRIKKVQGRRKSCTVYRMREIAESDITRVQQERHLDGDDGSNLKNKYPIRKVQVFKN